MITPAQREARRQGIGGSDAPPLVLGFDGFRTPLDVYASKVLDLPEETDDQRNAGNVLEPAIRELAARALGVPIREATETYRHRSRPWMLAHLDGLVADGGNLEAKALDWRKAKALGEQGTDHCLRPHFIQVQHQMEVTEIRWTHVAYLVGPYDLRLYLVERDREIGEIIGEVVDRFWKENVLARVAPPETDPDALVRFNRQRWPFATREELRAEPGSPGEEALRELADAVRARKLAQQAEKACAARVQALMGRARKITCDFGSVTWSTGKKTAWASVVKALGGAPKDLIEQHTKPNRRFLSAFENNEAEAIDASEE